MLEKLNIDQFEIMKKQMNDILRHAKLDDVDLNILKEQYLDLQNQLIYSDTSEIPAHYWQDIELINRNDDLNNLSNNRFGLDQFVEFVGQRNMQYVLRNHLDVLMYLRKNVNILKLTYNPSTRENETLDSSIPFEDAFKEKIRSFFYDSPEYLVESENGYTLPMEVSSLNLNVINYYKNFADIFNYDSNTFLINSDQQLIIRDFNIVYLKRFEEETSYNKPFGFFRFLETSESGYVYAERFLNKLKPYIENSRSYQEFKDKMAFGLNMLRVKRHLLYKFSYDYIEGPFREEYSYIFLDKSAPQELQIIYYSGPIELYELRNHKDWIKYLVDKDLTTVLAGNFVMSTSFVEGENGLEEKENNFIEEYSNLFGNLATLELFARYGNLIKDMSSFEFVGNSKSEIDKEIEVIVRQSIFREKDYDFLVNDLEFVKHNPDLFLDLSNSTLSLENQKEIETDFYRRNIEYDTIRKFPELIEFLKDKELWLVMIFLRFNDDKFFAEDLGNERFLYLCSKYGRYLEGVGREFSLMEDENDLYSVTVRGQELLLNFQELQIIVEEYIAQKCLSGSLVYHLSDAPEFLKEQYPEIFIDEDAPQELRSIVELYGLTFTKLHDYMKLMPYETGIYLEGKNLKPSLMRGCNLRSCMQNFFEQFGDTAMDLGMRYPKTVDSLVGNDQVELLKTWYLKTKGKFLPHLSVIQNFKADEIDKFLSNSKKWSILSQGIEFDNEDEEKDALVKLAYTFGVFDNDEAGFSKLKALLIDVPRHLDKQYNHIESYYDKVENYQEGVERDQQLIDLETNYEFFKLILTKVEQYPIDEDKPLMEQIYKKNKDGSYALLLDPKKYPKAAKLVRQLLESLSVSPVISHHQLHSLFGRFEMRYDPDFRDFFLTHFDQMMENREYIAKIQRQFEEIKSFNSNRYLTVELAISYVKDNEYKNIQVGNEELSIVSQQAGYSQRDVDTLQEIYNYGKQRVFSSIPRIENDFQDYHYEMLRLDDPLALAIGTLTDCCQELGNVAEQCMQHAMTSPDGRIFVVKDSEGSIIAQSWVWRNGNVICFDNIEVPDRQMHKNGISRGLEDKGIQNEFTDKVLEVYKQAAKELLKIDEEKYRQLLDEKTITQEQYDNLILNKVTIGEGYSNIKGSFKKLASDDQISHPLKFNVPVHLQKGLYTKDSNIQYILEKKSDVSTKTMDNLIIHHDKYIEYDDSNFTLKDLLRLKKLESLSNNSYDYRIQMIEGYENRYVSAIGQNYLLIPSRTKIIMHPNFAIIYEDDNYKIVIGDLIFNDTVNIQNQDVDITDKVAMQIRLALDQIGQNKEFSIKNLDDYKLDMYKRAMHLNDEIDIERGLKNGKKH